LAGSSSDLRSLEFSPVVRCNGIEDDETDAMPADSNWDLETEDVVLGFEVGSHDADYLIKRRLGVRSEKNGM
jgi:hypothetical protein